MILPTPPALCHQQLQFQQLQAIWTVILGRQATVSGQPQSAGIVLYQQHSMNADNR